MNIPTIEVDPDEARAKLAEYRGVLTAERTAEDDALAQAYRAVRRGLPVVRLSEAIHAGGYFDDGLPRIAIARADATQCWVEISRPLGHHHFTFRDTEWAENRGARVGPHTVTVTTPGPTTWASRTWRGVTTVPLVPPRYRPRRPRLSSCHVLWEVEAWDPTPPRDPALLRHLRGDLWAVLAVWDLTELERAVLTQRRPR